MAQIRIVRDGVLGPPSDDIGAALAAVDEPDTVVWFDLGVDELGPVADKLGFHHHAVEDALKQVEGGSELAQRTKLDRFPGHLFLYLFIARLDDAGELDLGEIPVFVRRGALVTVDRADAFEPDELTDRWEEHPELLRLGVGALVYGLLDLVVDSHLACVDELADAVDALEDSLFDGGGEDPRGVQQQSFATRKALVRMRRVAQPMRELTTGIMRREESGHSPMEPELVPYFQDVYDHVLRVNDTIEGLRDLITTIYETRLALVDHALNTVMRKLAGWAAIIAVPTAVTGFYGQNVPYPGYLQPVGFWISTAIWVSITLGLFFFLRNRNWI